MTQWPVAALLLAVGFLPVALPLNAAAPATATAPATAPAGTVLAVTEADNGKTLSLGHATTVTITLAGNATTGYSWAVTKMEGTALEQAGEIQYTPSRARPGMAGSGGTSTATFRAVKAGTSTITLAYARPWENGQPPAKTFQVTITVEKPSATAPAKNP